MESSIKDLVIRFFIWLMLVLTPGCSEPENAPGNSTAIASVINVIYDTIPARDPVVIHLKDRPKPQKTKLQIDLLKSIPSHDHKAIEEQGHGLFVNFTADNGLIIDMVNCIYMDSNGYLWIGYSGAGVTRYDGNSFTHFSQEEGLSGGIIRCIIEDQAGNMWFGHTNGLSKYDGVSFTNYSTEVGIQSAVVCANEDNSGNLWFGAINQGVIRYDGHSFTQFSKENGLASNHVLCMSKDETGNLWFGTDQGISKYDGISFSNYSQEEGLNTIFINSMLHDLN